MATAAAHQIQFGEPELGLWCPRCLLPSGYRVRAYGFADQMYYLGVICKCYDCDQPLPTDQIWTAMLAVKSADLTDADTHAFVTDDGTHCIHCNGYPCDPLHWTI